MTTVDIEKILARFEEIAVKPKPKEPPAIVEFLRQLKLQMKKAKTLTSDTKLSGRSWFKRNPEGGYILQIGKPPILINGKMEFNPADEASLIERLTDAESLVLRHDATRAQILKSALNGDGSDDEGVVVKRRGRKPKNA
ncbi:hypothetical protein [Agrobacterium tumefaciens]|uniref:Uncharacterized protein n=1 Tax=Agrobacterium tumefaciens TaxID=358 RepID=A0AB36EKL5_AGRTU|nr:hypothetical protein A6U91_18750 [Agrobacterium tumefaciens]